MSSPHNRNIGRGIFSRRSAQLPAFCRSRNSRTLLVSISSLRNLQRLLLLVLLFQLTTVLLVLSLLPAPLPSLALPSLLGASTRHDRQLKDVQW
jgi:hypothetical protein